MPNRILREGILTSKRVVQLSWPAEVFYRRLHSVADDFGRFFATPMMLRAAAYPLQLDKVSDSDIGKWLGETRKAGLVRIYESGGESYLEILDFRQQIRATKSKFPQPPPDAKQVISERVADAQQLPANAHLDGDGDGDGDEDSVEPQSASPPFLALPLNSGELTVTEAMVLEWERSFPAVDVRQQLREMRAWCLANPAKRKTARGAAGFIVRWLGKEQDRGGGKPEQGLPSYT